MYYLVYTTCLRTLFFFFNLKYFQNFIETKKTTIHHHLKELVQGNVDSSIQTEKSLMPITYLAKRWAGLLACNKHGRTPLDEYHVRQARNHTQQQ